jgi:hypothetical protein
MRHKKIERPGLPCLAAVAPQPFEEALYILFDRRDFNVAQAAVILCKTGRRYTTKYLAWG